MQIKSSLCTLALGLLLSGCAEVDSLSRSPSPAELETVLSGETLLSGQPPLPLKDGSELLALTDEMRDFARGLTAGKTLKQREKLDLLLVALQGDDRLGLRYEPGVTLNAADTFEHKQGNCVSLSALFVALARAIDLEVRFNEVEVPPTWDMLSESRFVFYKHINAVVDVGWGNKRTVELSSTSYSPNAHQRPISDKEVAAQYYNNLGIERLGDSNPAPAFHYLRSALALAPDVGYLWANLGTLYRRHQQYNEAELAYLQAHQLDTSDPVALSSLARLYRETDRPELADRFQTAARRYSEQNPYYQYQQARLALEEGSPALARKHIDAAIIERRDEFRFYYLAALIHQRLGNVDKMRRNIALAQKISTPAERLRYLRQLQPLTVSQQ